MLRNFFSRESRNAEGQTLVEYALILVLISLAVIVLLGTVGDELNNVFQDIVTALQGA